MGFEFDRFPQGREKMDHTSDLDRAPAAEILVTRFEVVRYDRKIYPGSESNTHRFAHHWKGEITTFILMGCHRRSSCFESKIMRVEDENL